MSKLDLTKPLQTKSGVPVAVVAAPDGYLYGYREIASGHCVAEVWSSSGELRSSKGQHYENNGSLCDLVNVPEKRTVKVWLNVYATWIAGHLTKETADNLAQAPGRIACIEHEITYTVGEGLEP